MISERVLTERMESVLSERLSASGWSPRQMQGYEQCFNDMQDIIKELVIDNRVKAKCRREFKKRF